MSSFSDADAHEDDPLTDHLESVARRALRSVADAPGRVQTAAVLLGLLHDAGKATPWFQAYLKGKTGSGDDRTQHSLLGAALANHALAAGTGDDAEEEWLRWVLVAGVAKHHGDFTKSVPKTLAVFCDRALETQHDTLRNQLEAFDATGFHDWLDDALDRFGIRLEPPTFETEEVLGSISSLHPHFDDPLKDLRDGFDLLTAFGALLGADKMHTAHADRTREPVEIPTRAVETYKEETFDEPEDQINVLREEIQEEILATVEEAPEAWIYTLTAPTGAGKTLAGLATGLALRSRRAPDGLPGRLVYCLPFTSVIDQNSEVYENVLKENGVRADDRALLKHHHLADPRYRVGDEHVEDGSELLVETWQSEIVVTTFHQLLYTLFTGRNKNLKRIAALQNAVVVLDEVQAIDHRYWDDVRRMMQLAAEQLGTTFVLMTATMPLVVERGTVPELLPSHEDRYEALARTVLVNRSQQPLRVEELGRELRERVEDEPERRRIVIVNRRDTVREIFDAVEGLPIQTAMLSTDLTPRDREAILDGLEEPFLLVSTQVIEAGVDVSSDVLIRDLAPLDSIIQSAGRCNRNFERDRGRVEVVRLEDENGKLAVPPYSSFLVQSTTEVLDDRETIDEAEFHELGQRYYEIVKQRSESTRIVDELADGAFQKLGPPEGLELVDDRPRQPHFIIQDDQDERLWNEYLQIQNMEITSREDFRERKRRFREIKRDFMERVVNYPSDERPREEAVPVYPDEGIYDPRRGLLENKAGKSYEFIG